MWMPPEMESELHRFQQVDSTLFGAKGPNCPPESRTVCGQFPVSGGKNGRFEMVPRGFEPESPGTARGSASAQKARRSGLKSASVPGPKAPGSSRIRPVPDHKTGNRRRKRGGDT